LTITLLFVGILITTFQYFLFAQTVNHNVNDVLTEPEYSELELEQAYTAYGGGKFFGGEASGSVTIVVGRSSDKDYPQLSQTLRQRIAEDTPRAVTVQVRFLDYQQASPAKSQNNVIQSS
jgi:hypothetical protein